MQKNPFDYSNPATPPLFVAREKELKEIRDALVNNNQSISISGANGIGKSSLVLTLLQKIMEENEKIFMVKIADSQLYDIIEGDFLRILAKEVCAEIWTRIFKTPFSELVEESIHYARNTKIDSKYKHGLKRIYRVVTSDNIVSSGDKKSGINVKLPISVQKGETNTTSYVRTPLTSSDFLRYLDELLEILESHGYTKIIVTCDQFNHLPPKANYELVSRNLDVLSSKRISFVVSAENLKNEIEGDMRVDTEVMLKSFSNWVTLNGYSSADDIKKYVHNCFNCHNINNIEFAEENYEIIYSVCEGNPWFITRMLYLACNDVLENRDKIVRSHNIEIYTEKFSNAIAKYNTYEGNISRPELNSLFDKS